MSRKLVEAFCTFSGPPEALLLRALSARELRPLESVDFHSTEALREAEARDFEKLREAEAAGELRWAIAPDQTLLRTGPRALAWFYHQDYLNAGGALVMHSFSDSPWELELFRELSRLSGGFCVARWRGIESRFGFVTFFAGSTVELKTNAVYSNELGFDLGAVSARAGTDSSWLLAERFNAIAGRGLEDLRKPPEGRWRLQRFVGKTPLHVYGLDLGADRALTSIAIVGATQVQVETAILELAPNEDPGAWRVDTLEGAREDAVGPARPVAFLERQGASAGNDVARTLAARLRCPVLQMELPGRGEPYKWTEVSPAGEASFGVEVGGRAFVSRWAAFLAPCHALPLIIGRRDRTAAGTLEVKD